MTYDPELSGCFGEIDKEFAIHPLDEKQAFEWLIKLRKNNTLWIDAKEQIREYLREHKVSEIAITMQINRARKMLGCWLPGPVGEEEDGEGEGEEEEEA